MKHKIVIVDDEHRAIELLKLYVEAIEDFELVETFRNPFKAFHFLATERIDLLLLDINMPQLSGLDLLKGLEDKPCVILTTAHPNYALEGFELDVVDYLMKPINKARFERAIDKYKKIKLGLQYEHIAVRHPLYIKSGPKEYKLFWDEVTYLEKSENYVIYHISQGKKILSRVTLGEIEDTLPPYMVRTHKSYAVSLRFIDFVQRNAIVINGIEIPVGRTYKETFHSIYKEYQKRGMS